MLKYDETALAVRLSALSRQQKTAFAAACAQRLFPLYERYATATGVDSQQLAGAIRNTWRALKGESVDLSLDKAIAEGLVPSDDGQWSDNMGYGQNGAAAAAFAIRTWLTDDPQEAVWAARQVYEAADYAAQRVVPELDFNASDAEQMLLETDVVQVALSGLLEDLNDVETRPDSRDKLCRRVDMEGRAWALLVP